MKRQRHAIGSYSCWQLHFPILVERMREGEWVEKGCLSISQYDQCMWGKLGIYIIRVICSTLGNGGCTALSLTGQSSQ